MSHFLWFTVYLFVQFACLPKISYVISFAEATENKCINDRHCRTTRHTCHFYFYYLWFESVSSVLKMDSILRTVSVHAHVSGLLCC